MLFFEFLPTQGTNQSTLEIWVQSEKTEENKTERHFDM